MVEAQLSAAKAMCFSPLWMVCIKVIHAATSNNELKVKVDAHTNICTALGKLQMIGEITTIVLSHGWQFSNVKMNIKPTYKYDNNSGMEDFLLSSKL